MMGLFTPAWKSRNEKRALKAVKKMTDQQKLEIVAKEARSEYGAQGSGKKTDQPSFACILRKE
jgi:hypothetical protein